MSDGKDLHQGIDLCGGNNLSIYASRAGDVAFKGYNDWFGYYICLYHGEWNGYKIYSSYMHFAEPAYFSVGETVQAGQVIGKMGTTGSSTGVHLHFQIFKTKGYATSANLPHDNETQLNANYINTNPSKATMEAWGLVNNHPERFNNSSHPSCKYGTIAYMKVGTPATPTTPTITSVSTVSTSSLKVTWNPVSGATAYRIDRRRSGDEGYSTIVSSTTSTSYTDTGLLAGEKYYYRVYALNGSVISDRSETAGAYTQCDIPTITSAIGDSTSSITIKWSYVNGAANYRIDRRKQTEDAYTTIVTGYTANRTYTDTGLEAGSKYYYRVYAVNENSTSAKPDGYGGYTQCEIPTITSIAANSPSSITIKWNGVSGASSYRIDRRKQSDDVYTTIVTDYTSESYTDIGLEAGTKYYYRIYAVTEGSVSAKPEGEGTFTKYIYSITYNANGGSGTPGSQSKIQDTALTLSSTQPTRTGYSFVNWNTKADGSGTAYKDGGSYTANSDITLYAQWTANKYTVTLNNQSAITMGTDSVSATYASAMPSITVPQKTGYTFCGYYDEIGGSGTQYYKGDGTSARSWNKTSATTLYAKWTANTYKVTFNANGGTTPIVSKNVTYESTYVGLPKPTRDGYTFEGWYDSASGGTEIKNNSKVSTASAHKLYAQWTENVFAEEFSCVGDMTYNGHYYQLFNDVVSWEYAKEYCERIGGHLVTISDEEEDLMIASLMGNHLSDEATHYWIGATTCDTSENMQWVTGEPFEYVNWNKNEPDDAGQYWMCVTATKGKWNDYFNKRATMGFICEFEFLIEKPIVVTFNANGGTTPTASKNIIYNETYGVLPTPTKKGYKFKGWFTSVNGKSQITDSTKVTTTSAQTLYAQWDANTYIVTFNANGGVGYGKLSSHTYDVEASLAENTFIRDGFTFLGWSLDESATVATYSDKESVKNLTENDGENVVLYAVWLENEVEKPEVKEYSFAQSVQIGLIEPWFLKANLLVYTDSMSKSIDYNTLKDYGAYFIRKSELSDISLTQSTIRNEDILNNPNAVKKSKLSGTAGIDGSLLTANYDKGLYTYEMGDSVLVLFYVEDEAGIQYAPIRERNIKSLLDERKNNTQSYTNVLERNVYDKMSILEGNVKKYRAQFDEVTRLPDMSAPVLSKHVSQNGAFTDETVKTYTFGNSVQLVLVEPWGLKVNAIVQKSGKLIDYNSVEEYGAIVFYDTAGKITSGKMTAEELRTKSDAYVFSSEAGDATIDGSLITALYNKGIYTYQLNSNAYVMFYVKDADGYHYGDVKVRNAYELAKARGADTSGNYGEQEKIVYQDIVTMYETVTAYRDDYFGKN